jgi:hypothetical protein
MVVVVDGRIDDERRELTEVSYVALSQAYLTANCSFLLSSSAYRYAFIVKVGTVQKYIYHYYEAPLLPCRRQHKT